jgi:hypothetical protein
VPWIVAIGGILVVAGVGVGLYRYKDSQREAAAAEQQAINSGTIEIHSVPEGASIWLNDAPTPHRTPHTLRNLATGPNARFAVKLTAEGYAPFTQQVPLATRDARATVTGQLERARAESYAVLEVSTTPRGAAVLVDGRQIAGTTPLTVPELAPGVEHTVLVRHPDTVDETFAFVGEAGQVERRTLTLHERPLAPDEAWVNVTTEPAGVVLHIGERVIDTGSPFRVRVHSGQILRFAFSAPGYESMTRQVRARAGQTLSLPTVRLQRPAPTANAGAAPVVDRRPGSLRVGSSPWCNVTVDGRAHGQTPVDISSIAPGTHTVVCTNPARGAQTQRITVQPGQQAIARFRFP